MSSMISAVGLIADCIFHARRARTWDGSAPDAEILRLSHLLENPKGEQEFFYLACVESWDFNDRCVPELGRDDRGEYLLEEVSVVLRQALQRGDLLTA
ncbi:hypothetical protein BX286_0042 [Streptomyces sp. 3211.6]|uniref:hypothetical protein n=1 Tax=Streptomyces sp. 3211.6 TaxID=1938845 RepID=UPI000F19330E|nr:hypothetical protein [Streptomyces sp. 3211.6]RKT02177.1 hypothetical protein BX286_0042 [Streptomyces sp. 3211.6]